MDLLLSTDFCACLGFGLVFFFMFDNGRFSHGVPLCVCALNGGKQTR